MYSNDPREVRKEEERDNKADKRNRKEIRKW